MADYSESHTYDSAEDKHLQAVMIHPTRAHCFVPPVAGQGGGGSQVQIFLATLFPFLAAKERDCGRTKRPTNI
jgi:hypothetical protein